MTPGEGPNPLAAAAAAAPLTIIGPPPPPPYWPCCIGSVFFLFVLFLLDLDVLLCPLLWKSRCTPQQAKQALALAQGRARTSLDFLPRKLGSLLNRAGWMDGLAIIPSVLLLKQSSCDVHEPIVERFQQTRRKAEACCERLPMRTDGPGVSHAVDNLGSRSTSSSAAAGSHCCFCCCC